MSKATMHIVALYWTCLCCHWKHHCQVLQIRLMMGRNSSPTNIMNWQWAIARTLSAVGKRTCIRTCVKNYCSAVLNSSIVISMVFMVWDPTGCVGLLLQLAMQNYKMPHQPGGQISAPQLCAHTYSQIVATVWLKQCERIFEVQMAVCVLYIYLSKTTHCITQIGRQGCCKWKNTEFWKVAWHWHGH